MPSVLKPEALAALTNLKEELGISSGDTSKDNQLERLINRATAKIEERTGRKLKARRYNGNTATPPANKHSTTGVTDEDFLFFSGSTQDKGGDTDVVCGSGVFYLPAWPVQPNSDLPFALATLTDRSASGETFAETLVEWDDYVVDRENGVLRLLRCPFAAGFRNYRITCTAGYLESAAPYVPDDLEALCLLMSKKLYRDDAGVTSERIGTWSRSFDPEKAETDIKEGLALFRRWSL